MKYLIFLLAPLLTYCTINKDKEPKPNVLFIFIDDLAYDALAYQGNNTVQTPTIDKLSASGLNFSHAYNMGSWSGAVCTASRSMLISGKSVWRANRHREKWQGKPDSVAVAQTWGKLMESQGYDTYMTGKWHVDLPAKEVFQNVRNVRGGMPKDNFNYGTRFSERNKLYKAGKLTYDELMPLGYNRPKSPTDITWQASDMSNGGFWEGGKHWSEVLKEDAFTFADMASQRDKPYFMYLAFNAAHDPRQSPQEYIDLYPLESIEIPENYRESYPFKDEIGLGYSLRDEALAPFPRSKYAIKVHLQEYYAMITHLDEQIGDILEDFEQKGLLENTLVIFTADHGLAIGSHGLMGKQNMYDHSIRVPFILNGAGIPEGKEIKADIYLQDAMATALEVAGFKETSFIEFNSLIPLTQGARISHHQNGIYGAYLNKQRMIRKDGYKLIVYPDAKVSRLYNLVEDPQELNDLSKSSENSSIKRKLFLDLKKLQKELDDPLDLGEEVY